MRVIILLFVLAGLAETLHAQPEVVLVPVKDNVLFFSETGALSSGVGSSLYIGRTNTAGVRRSLMAFDVSSEIPVGATIESAALTLELAQTNTGAQSATLHRVLADWGEGTSNSSGGRGADATAGDATWLHTFFDTETWTAPGGDFDTTASAILDISDLGTYTFESTPELVADVQSWIDDAKSNFGLIMIGNEITPQSALRFDSREGVNPPMLTVTFSVATALEDVPQPGLFELESYPNPFSGHTTLAYTLSTPQDVQVEVFSILGQPIRTLADGRQAAGRHRFTFEAENLPSGVYLYRVTTPTQSAVRRLVVVG